MERDEGQKYHDQMVYCQESEGAQLSTFISHAYLDMQFMDWVRDAIVFRLTSMFTRAKTASCYGTWPGFRSLDKITEFK